MKCEQCGINDIDEPTTRSEGAKYVCEDCFNKTVAEAQARCKQTKAQAHAAHVARNRAAFEADNVRR